MAYISQPQKRVPLPPSMRTLPRDHRDYPVPFVVSVDRNRTPQFTINDWHKAELCRRKRLCAICGKRMNRSVWFIGGAKCFLHPQGAFVDPPSHLECAEYALQVCPFLAAPSYAKRIDDRKLQPGAMRPTDALVVNEMPDAQPTLFGLGAASSYGYTGGPGGVFYVERWDYVEFWHDGEPKPAPRLEEIEL